MYGGKAISNKYVFRFYECFRRFNRNRHLPFANIQLSFRNKKLFGNGLCKGHRYIREI